MQRNQCERFGHMWQWPDARTLLSTCLMCGATRDGKLNWLEGYPHLTMPSKEQGYIPSFGFATIPYELEPEQ